MCKKPFFSLSLLLLLAAASALTALAQDPASSPAQEATPVQGAGRMQGPREGRGGLFGKITSIGNRTIELAKPDGTTATVKITDKTQFRKDRQDAKLTDFKVGDLVMVRAEDNGNQGLKALLVAGRTGAGAGGPGMGGPGGNMMMMGAGELGKDYVFGEVKSVDAPKITVLRPDNVTQTLELNEETSLRKGRESVTMADIQPGDHVFIRGGVQNNVFVPKMVMVIGPEQWKRMQDMGMVTVGNKPAGDSKPNPPQP
jgi:preprotein translocase subunit YajC